MCLLAHMLTLETKEIFLQLGVLTTYSCAHWQSNIIFPIGFANYSIMRTLEIKHPSLWLHVLTYTHVNIGNQRNLSLIGCAYYLFMCTLTIKHHFPRLDLLTTQSCTHWRSNIPPSD